MISRLKYQLILLLKLFIYLFVVYFWLSWVFIAAHRLSLVVASRLGSCGVWAYLPKGIWNLPEQGMESASPALGDGFLTNGTKEVPRSFFNSMSWDITG